MTLGDHHRFTEVEKPLRLLRPVPVYLLLSGSIEDENVNVMAMSWVSPVSKTPPKIGAVIDKSNYSYNLIVKYRWFTLAIVDVGQANLVKYVGTHSRREEDKIKKVGLKVSPWKKDPRVPVLLDSLGFLVCHVERVIDLGPSAIFIAKIVDAYVREGLFDEDRGWNLNRTKVLLHKAKHSFAYPCGEIVVTRTPWGVAVKRPWRKLFDKKSN